jgi:hypothetical protein
LPTEFWARQMTVRAVRAEADKRVHDVLSRCFIGELVFCVGWG